MLPHLVRQALQSMAVELCLDLGLGPKQLQVALKQVPNKPGVRLPNCGGVLHGRLVRAPHRLRHLLDGLVDLVRVVSGYHGPLSLPVPSQDPTIYGGLLPLELSLTPLSPTPRFGIQPVLLLREGAYDGDPRPR